MKQPWYKVWLSYFYDVHIESTSSAHNDALHVDLVKGRYQLSTDRAIYSFADKYDNFLKVFNQLNLQSDTNQSVLILGFGLGSIPFMLENVFKKQYQYTGVEIDEEVTYLATKYVLDELISDIQLITADAVAFIHQDSDKYDIVCVDIFIDDQIPKTFKSKEFLNLLSKLLVTNTGVVIFNNLYQSEKDKKEATRFFESEFISAFPNAGSLNTGGNLMLISNKHRLIDQRKP